LRLFKEGPAKNLGKKTRTTIFRLFGEGPMEKTKEHQKSLKETETCKKHILRLFGEVPMEKTRSTKRTSRKPKKQKQPKHPIF
jgi:sulfur relay (sulfurtransferase) DsrC/TusE family protein